jgi:hypothetical protein
MELKEVLKSSNSCWSAIAYVVLHFNAKKKLKKITNDIIPFNKCQLIRFLSISYQFEKQKISQEMC